MSSVDPRHLAELNRLLQHDGEAIAMLDHAVEDLDDPELLQLLRGFRADHARHLADLAQAISDLGGTSVVPDPGPRHSARQPKAARTVLVTLRSNQYRACALHESVASLALPKPAWRVVERNLEDERRHLEIVESLLAASNPSWRLESRAS
ncbi:MAG: ferritin-like domain-containing protein [Kofleriaceae bacterium]